jgi:exodeoxyribonuclease-3
MHFVSYNVNGVRARQHQLALVVENHDPDIIALQETKVVDEDFPVTALNDLGYPHLARFGQKGHYGVAVASRHQLQDVQLGIPWQSADQQRRFIHTGITVGSISLRVINGYFPQGGSRSHPTKFADKAIFYRDLLRFLNEQCDPGEIIILAGDMNVAPADLDVGIGSDNAKRWLKTGKAGFLPEERAWLDALIDWGFEDCFSQPESEEKRRYSWFDYRSRGFERDPRRGLRIDLILCTRSLRERLVATGIDYEIRGSEKSSDHCPVWAEFGL